MLMCLLTTLAASASAHHSVLAFDNTRGMTLRGVVTGLHWADPHTYILVGVRGRDGREERWRVESESAIVLRRLGWTTEALPGGTPVVIVGAPARDGTRALRCDTVTARDAAPLPCHPERGP